MDKCKHFNIVRYYETLALEEGKILISMELCDAGSLFNLYEKSKITLDETQISFVLREALKGIAFLHENKVIHRDIKAGNFLITSDGDVKLADFGISASLKMTLDNRKTTIGSPYWMAPEVIKQEERYSYSADIWSVGITAIELVDGKPPLSNVHAFRVIFMIPERKPPKAKKKIVKHYRLLDANGDEINPDDESLRFPFSFENVARIESDTSPISDELKDFIAVCLRKKQERRPTCEQLLNHPFIQMHSYADRRVLLPVIARSRNLAAWRERLGEPEPEEEVIEGEEEEQEEEDDGDDDEEDNDEKYGTESWRIQDSVNKGIEQSQDITEVVEKKALINNEVGQSGQEQSQIINQSSEQQQDQVQPQSQQENTPLEQPNKSLSENGQTGFEQPSASQSEQTPVVQSHQPPSSSPEILPVTQQVTTQPEVQQNKTSTAELARTQEDLKQSLHSARTHHTNVTKHTHQTHATHATHRHGHKHDKGNKKDKKDKKDKKQDK
ncbi:MAG: putative Serine/threonine-protein kinase dst2, partial [Streblomastix strix]